MHKLISFFIQASAILLLVLPLVNSSQEHVKSIGNHPSKDNNNNHKLSHKLLFEITLHGFLLWTSMGFFMPVGILVIRMSNREKCGRRLKFFFYVHAISQIMALFFATTGAILSFKNFKNSFDNNHQRVGLALYGLIWLQALLGFSRPHRGSKARSIWYFGHWKLGTMVSLLGVLNIYTGLHAYHEKTSKKIWLWTTIFTTQLCFTCFFYLLQDKWEYIKKQGVILGNEFVRPTATIDQISSTEKQKELVTESC